MKIGIAVPSSGFRGGLERYAHDVATTLAARGHELVLLHGTEPGRDTAEYVRPFQRSLPFAEARSVAGGLDVVYVQKARSLAELAPLGDAPVVLASHDHDLTCARSHRYLPVGHAPCHRAPGVACVAHGCVVVRGRGSLPLALVDPFALRRRLLELAARAPIVACSRYLAERIVEAGVARARVRAIHPIPPPDPRAPAPRPEEPRLVVVGQLLRGKGIDLAIRALAELPAAVTLEVAGDGPSRDELETLARTLVPGRVRFHGYVAPDQVHEVYDRASVVLVPSRWPEPFGMVGVEALRRGRPVVAAAHGGIPEWLPEGRGGASFVPGDVAGLARAINGVLADETAAERALESARAFSHDGSIDQLLAVFQAARRAA